MMGFSAIGQVELGATPRSLLAAIVRTLVTLEPWSRKYGYRRRYGTYSNSGN